MFIGYLMVNRASLVWSCDFVLWVSSVMVVVRTNAVFVRELIFMSIDTGLTLLTVCYGFCLISWVLVFRSISCFKLCWACLSVSNVTLHCNCMFRNRQVCLFEINAAMVGRFRLFVKSYVIRSGITVGSQAHKIIVPPAVSAGEFPSRTQSLE